MHDLNVSSTFATEIYVQNTGMGRAHSDNDEEGGINIEIV